MALDLTGISNENEFYTHHYLSAILENDLKELFKRWQAREEQDEIRAPYKELRPLARDYFRMRSRLERERDPAVRLELQREFLAGLVRVLGYEWGPSLRDLGEAGEIRILVEVASGAGVPQLWVLEAVDAEQERSDPLELTLQPLQFPAGQVSSNGLFQEPFEELIGRRVFAREEPPRWALLCSDSQILLLDRTKWNEKRLLRFDLDEIFGRRELSTLRATAALLHRESVCPEDGLSLLDTLDENSHKHAFAVSEDLKYALRESIELIGNEAVYYLREVRKEKVYDRKLAEDLTLECLRFMYRLLFLFYIEARPELGYAPMKSEAYLDGYSLESLRDLVRDLEMVPLTSEESRNGTFIHESLNLLFDLIYNGCPPEEKSQLALKEEGEIHHHTFRIAPLRSHLFDPRRTPILQGVRLRNSVLLRVLELMSLSRPKGKRDRRGRISYAQLGINQLGAVYEGLLSYRGFFAETDLYEVKKAKEKWDELEIAYFVKAEDLDKYTEDEKVYNEDGTLRKYDKGTFIYRLAGRDRQKSASYYTPEVLTRCLVKYALKELLQDKTADEILDLTICEPAMGSAAFLNEAVNQLAEAYLERKQKELGESIPHDEYTKEKQRVKMYLADNNVYGVDLNPVAVELAEVSLWLNTIYEGAYVPWFGMQLACGNSLIGARREVFDASLLGKSKAWLKEVPERIEPGSERPEDGIYHFLVPDLGMAKYQDKVVKQLVPDRIRAIDSWRKDFCRGFSRSEIQQLRQLSEAVDRLWKKHIQQQRSVRERTSDQLTVFGHPEVPTLRRGRTEEKDRIHEQELLSRDVRNSSPYRRLKLALDYWCALWFWPIEESELLPTREEFLLDLSLILEGDLLETSVRGDQLSMFPDTIPRQQALEMVDEFGFVDVDKLSRENPRLELVRRLGEKLRFHHWDLEFGWIFADRGGFDLVLGNPPWIKLGWNEGDVLGDSEPLFVIGSFSAAQIAGLREELLTDPELRTAYYNEFSDSEGSQNFLNATQNYPLLIGIQSNLYKCFIPQSWRINSADGFVAFLHPEGVYDDPKGGRLRNALYARLKYHFQFENELNLFQGTNDHGRLRFGLNISASKEGEPNFISANNLFAPGTIDICFEGYEAAKIPGIKNEANKWEIQGDYRRLLHIGPDELGLFASLYDPEGTPALQARLPNLHARALLRVLEKFAAQPRRLGDLEGEYLATVMWDETNRQKDGTIRRETRFPESLEEWILSGPHFYVGNPLNKTPRRICNANSHYDALDLTELPENYLPRTNYVPNADREEYFRRVPRVPWNGRPVTDFYRVVNREMLNQAGERTYLTAVIPPMAGHVNTLLATTFRSLPHMIIFYAASVSIPLDFRVKSTGMGHANVTLISQLPILNNKPILQRGIIARASLLLCLGSMFQEFWRSVFCESFRDSRWSREERRLEESKFECLTEEWDPSIPLRTDYERRQALVEIDVLVAMALDLTLDELQTIYRIQFPVLHQNEADTWYDQKGRIVFTCSRGLPGVGFSRPEWDQIKEMQSGTVERTITDDTLPGGPRERIITYHAPFDRCDREEDYEIAWRVFERRIANGEMTL